MADFHIRVVVDPRQGQRAVKSMRRSLGGLERQGRGIGKILKGALVFAGIGAGLRQLTQLADRFTHLQNRLKTVTEGEEVLTAVTERLFDVANRTRAPFKATAEIYTRVALASRQLKTSQEELINFTESLNKAVILSGATAQEAEAGMLQLSQGLASGSLRGEELRSVLEQIPVVADVIANSIGTTRGELRKMGERGEITADIVLKAFREARVELDERFGETIPTIDQAFTILRNSVTKAVGDFNKGSGSATKFAGFIIELSKNTDKLTEALYVVSDVVTATVEETQKLFGPLTEQMATWGIEWDTVFKSAGLAVLVLLQTVAQIFDKIIGITTAVVAIIVTNFKTIPKALADIFLKAFNGVVGIVEKGINKIVDGINLLNKVLPDFAKFDPLEQVEFGRVDNKFEGEARALGAQIAELMQAGMEQSALEDAVVGVIDTVFDRAAERSSERKAEQADLSGSAAGGPPGVNTGDTLFQKILADLALQAELLRLNAKEAEYLTIKLDAEKEIRRELTAVEEDQLRAAVGLIQSLRDQARVLDEIEGPYRDIYDRQDALNELFNRGRITVEQYNEAVRKLHLEMLELATDLDSGYARGVAKVNEELHNLAQLSESVVTGAFEGMEQSIVDFVTTGEANMKQFVDSVLADLTRILIRWLLLKAIGLLPGGSAGTAAASAAGGTSIGGGVTAMQTGGSFSVGGSGGPDSQLVAFRATPGERVDVSRPGQNRTGAMQGGEGVQSSQGDVKIINTMDPSMALDAMGTAEGERLIMNVIQRNPNAVRRLLGGI